MGDQGEATRSSMTDDFSLTDLWGEMRRSSDVQSIARLLHTLDRADREHGEVAVSRPDGWAISAFANGNVVLENAEDGSIRPRHMKAVARMDAIRLMSHLAEGNLPAVEAEAWLPGYPPAGD